MTNKLYLDNRTFFKPDYYKALEYIVPKYILTDEIAEFGKNSDILDQVINSHIDAASSISSVLYISSISGTVYSGLDTIEGISNYFVKQNKLSEISPRLFEEKILNRVGMKFRDFQTSSDFYEYLSEDLLPSIKVNEPTSDFILTSTASDTHLYLIENLSWLYFLNTSGTSFDPSSYVSEVLVDKLYNGNTISIDDCIKGLSKHLWYNFPQFIPDIFLSSTGTYTSGTQQLDKLSTWIEVVYSPLYADRADFAVKNRFELFIDSGLRIDNKIPNGPFSKFLRAISFLTVDIDNKIEEIKSLYDIEDCPVEYLPLLSEIIGWKLFGSNPERWRLQLKNAVEVYKKVGTKASLQFALNSVFPKDIFSIESRIAELWESYVPYLIYFSLATESDYFESKVTWTKALSDKMLVGSYSTSSLDENIRLATDRIIYETYLEFSSSFNIPNIENEFTYRNRSYPIPPFEEYPYYINVELSQDMIDFISDRLACFGVRKEFVLQFRDYLIDNTQDVDEEIRSSSWLFFTSGYNEPPNLQNIISNINSKKSEYISLWSGKSSHFKLTFDATEFDFSNSNEDDISSGGAVQIASQIISEFSPAHAIPLVNLQLSAEDLTNFSETNFPILDFIKNELAESNQMLCNKEVSGLSVGAYTRNNTGGTKFKRKDFQSLASPLLTNATSAGNIPRNSLRKPSYENVISKEKYYDRTGFNSPTSWDMSASLSGIVLGFIPSSLSFKTIDNYSSIPEVYSRCYSVNSSASIYGYNVSNTLIGRGHVGISDRDAYCDRNQVPEIYATMHTIKERAKVIEASAIYGPADLSELKWKNVYQSYANQATEVSGWFPNAVEDFYNFSFGYDYHQLYRTYTKEFDRHRLSEDLHYIDGPNIFSHVFGPLLFNHDFKTLASAGESFLTTELSSIITISNGGTVFSQAGSSVGTYIASASDSMYLAIPEFVNSGILSGIELVQTSGAGANNSFSIFRLENSQNQINKRSYLVDKTLLAMRSATGLPRIRFDIKKPSLPSSLGYPIQTNFLLPNHKFSITTKATITQNDGNTLGGRILGIWIHTKPEDGVMWSYNNSGYWVQHDQLIERRDLYNYYAHTYRFPEVIKDIQSSQTSGNSNLKCIEISNNSSEIQLPLNLTSDDFTEFTVEFNTNNRTVLLGRDYQRNYNQLHRKDQNYIIEVFLFPNQILRDRYLIIESVEMKDLTLNKMSQILVIDGCPEYRVETTKPELESIFRYWNDISGKNSKYGLASMDSAETSSVMGTSGGSRTDYRKDYNWLLFNYYGGIEGSVIEQLQIDI